jgi:hypothetical protein
MALAWEDELEAITAPGLVLAPPGPMLDPLVLRAQAMARHPGMAVDFLPLTVAPGHALRLRASWPDPARAQPWDELFIDPTRAVNWATANGVTSARGGSISCPSSIGCTIRC